MNGRHVNSLVDAYRLGISDTIELVKKYMNEAASMTYQERMHMQSLIGSLIIVRDAAAERRESP